VSFHPLRCLPAASAPCGASHLAREGRLAGARAPFWMLGEVYDRYPSLEQAGNPQRVPAAPPAWIRCGRASEPGNREQIVGRHENEHDKPDEQQPDIGRTGESHVRAT